MEYAKFQSIKAFKGNTKLQQRLRTYNPTQIDFIISVFHCHVTEDTEFKIFLELFHLPSFRIILIRINFLESFHLPSIEYRVG